MYNCVFDMNNITLVTLENKCPPNKLDFLILPMTSNAMPNKININNAIIHHCILHTQYISCSFGLAASVPLLHCRSMFGTNAFGFD